MDKDLQTEALLGQLDTIEARVVPTSRNRRQVATELLSLGALLLITVSLQWDVTNPFLLAWLGAVGLGRLVPLLRRRRLSRERDRLIRQHDRVVALAERHRAGGVSPPPGPSLSP